MLKHDAPLKRLYQLHKLVISLVKDFSDAMGLEPELIETLDLDKISLGSTELVDDAGNKHLCDLVWKIPSLEMFGHFILYLIIEFQSTFDPSMVERIVEYAALFEKRAQQNRKPGDPEIRMRTATIYTGGGAWRAPVIAEPSSGHLGVMPPGYHYGRVIDARRHPLDDLNPTGAAVAAMRLEQAGDTEGATAALYQAFDHHAEDHVRRAFYSRAAELEWLNEPGGGRVSYEQLLMEYLGGTMAEAQRTRFQEIIDEHRAEARAEAWEEGRAEGRTEGMNLGLRRMVARRFDAETVEHFVERVGSVDDPDLFAELDELIAKCESVEELLTRAHDMVSRREA